MEILKKKYQVILSRLEQQREESRRLWNIGQETVDFLALLLKLKKPKNILELGTSNGYSAFWIATITEDFASSIETIECDEERYNMAKENLATISNIKIHFAKAEEIIPNLENNYDFVFIDANKEQYHHYLDLLIPKLNDQALIVADNVLSHQHSVKLFSKKLHNNHNFDSITIPIESGLEVAIYNSF
ncbi:MAG: class I SAM-dependent methyltransferase [Candidatus Cloacimonetes bacterium]|nr:class I SAM-dependent methyltransferase [Candidatus Cloacimonadota bacterium]